MELLTSFYYPNNKYREKELTFTLINNLNKPFITKNVDKTDAIPV